MTSRRTVVGWLSGLGASLGIGLRARPAEAEIDVTEQGAGLSTAMVSSLAETVLPGELGDGGVARVSRGFTQWVAGYRPGAEIVHPYGSARIRQTGPSPAARWRAQLTALDRDAREKHRRAFTALNREQRRALVTAALSTERTNRMPDPVDANHIAMALIAWYFSTPEAVDLCYNAQIGRTQCRPLVNAPRQPLPLRRGGRETADGQELPKRLP